MRVANADGRAVLVVDDGIVDIATASAGRCLPTPSCSTSGGTTCGRSPTG